MQISQDLLEAIFLNGFLLFGAAVLSGGLSEESRSRVRSPTAPYCLYPVQIFWFGRAAYIGTLYSNWEGINQPSFGDSNWVVMLDKTVIFHFIINLCVGSTSFTLYWMTMLCLKTSRNAVIYWPFFSTRRNVTLDLLPFPVCFSPKPRLLSDGQNSDWSISFQRRSSLLVELPRTTMKCK